MGLREAGLDLFSPQAIFHLWAGLYGYQRSQPKFHANCSRPVPLAPRTSIPAVAASISRSSSGVSSMAAGPRFSFRRRIFRTPGTSSIHDAWASSHASAI